MFCLSLSQRSLVALALVPLVPLVMGLAAGASQAAPVVFSNAPFAGSSANPSDGVRTVFGGAERSLPTFNTATDSFVFDTTAFGLPLAPLSFVSSAAAGLSGAGAKVIVLQDTDNDGNPATAFNAGAAANLIANALSEDGAGFFIYWNSVLGVNRLVYSSNLNSTTGDLAILARVLSPTGAAAAAALPSFNANNFAVANVPEPSSLALMSAGLLALALRRGAKTSRSR